MKNVGKMKEKVKFSVREVGNSVRRGVFQVAVFSGSTSLPSGVLVDGSPLVRSRWVGHRAARLSSTLL